MIRFIMPEFISTKEAAKRLGVSIAVIKQWAKSGKIRAWKLSERAWMIDADSLKGIQKDPRGRPPTIGE